MASGFTNVLRRLKIPIPRQILTPWLYPYNARCLEINVQMKTVYIVLENDIPICECDLRSNAERIVEAFEWAESENYYNRIAKDYLVQEVVR